MIMAVNLLGNPNDFQRIKNIIKNRDIILFEDNCESLGATFNGQQAGTFGEIGTFSSFFSHHISTMEGGIIAIRDEELYHILLSIRSHGWTRHLPKHNHLTGVKSDSYFEESWKFVLPGYNLRPVEMSGAIGIEQLKKLPQFVAMRRENALYFQSKFSAHPELIMQKEIGNSSWFGFSLLLRNESNISRNEIIDVLEKNKIDCRPIVAGNFVRNPVMKYFNYEVFGDLKNADYISSNGFMLGNHHVNCREYIDYLFETVNKLF